MEKEKLSEEIQANECEECCEGEFCEDGEECEYGLCSEDQITLLQEQIAKMQENFMREAADFENLKKRLAREKESAVSFANESFAKELLAVFDALNAAISVSEASDEFKKGIENIRSVLLSVFAKFGITQIKSEGEFDPEFHNALNYVQNPQIPSGHIASVLQEGFVYHDRVLRPAMVLVAK